MNKKIIKKEYLNEVPVWIPRPASMFSVFPFFFFDQRLLRFLWDMNSALRQINSVWESEQ